MHRFFIKKENILNDRISIEGDDVQHIRKVLRLEPGDRIVLCDSEGTDYLTVIERIDKNYVEITIIDKEASKGEPDIDVVLYQGIPKSNKMDIIIQKCTEMGIRRIVPVNTVRTVVKLETQKDERKKIERWARIAEEAAKQSGRGRVPDVDMPMTMEQAVVDSRRYDIALIPYEMESTVTLKNTLEKGKADSIGFFIGPEGGFEAEEVEKAKASGVIPVTLGKRILRTETAGIVVLASIMYHYNQME